MKHRQQIFNYLVILVWVFFSGCTTHTRGPILAENLSQAATTAFQSYVNSVEATCSDGYDGDGSISWEYALGTMASAGYFKLEKPASVFFSALNPLNQPFFAVATDGVHFSTVDTRNNTHLSGSVRSFALRNDIPLAFLAGRWASWLLGKPAIAAPSIIAIREDTEKNGYWFTLSAAQSATIAREHLLIDPRTAILLKRSILDNDEKPLAMFSYSNWQKTETCQIPGKIVIEGLSFGTKATIELKAIKPARFSDGDFRLHAPEGYRRLLMP